MWWLSLTVDQAKTLRRELRDGFQLKKLPFDSKTYQLETRKSNMVEAFILWNNIDAECILDEALKMRYAA